MAFSPEFLDELRTRLPLAGIVGRRVKLVKRGREHSGLCPFHSEKSPSFTVSEDKGFFHCFGCGAHGDVIGFVMRSEGLSFPEAIERLAGEAGIAVPQSSPAEREREKQRATLVQVLEAATLWFEAQLGSPGGAEARSYLAGRGLSAETIAAFRLGYAPGRRGALRKALAAQGIDDNLMIEAGLLKRPDGDAQSGPPNNQELRDYFFNRIIFPITDRRGRPVAFGGRTLGDSSAKYLNSPETPLFHKGGMLYNLARARQAAHDSGEVIVVEGYMDVIALSQAGFAAAVAPLGTAITEDQISQLWRLAAEPILCLDGDQAGQRAGFRAAERALPLLQPGYSLRFAVLPQGEDPDSLVRNHGAQSMRAVLDDARPLVDMLWLMAGGGKRFDTPERQAGLAKALMEKVQAISSNELQTAYREAMNVRFQDVFGYGIWGGARRSGGRFGGRAQGQTGGTTQFSGTTGQFRGRRDRQGGRGDRGLQARPVTLGGEGLGARQSPDLLRQRQEQVLLAALVNHPALLADYVEDLAALELSSAVLRDFRGHLVDFVAGQPDLDCEALKCHLSEQGYSGVLNGLLSPEVYAHGRFARPGESNVAAGDGVRHILAVHRTRRAATETEEAGRRLAENMTEENLARVEATRQLSQNDEDDFADEDSLELAGRQDSN